MYERTKFQRSQRVHRGYLAQFERRRLIDAAEEWRNRGRW
jgi:hypothetical protein